MKHEEANNEVDDKIIEEYLNRFVEAINDDLNMPLAMGIVWEVARNDKKTNKFAKLLLEFDKVLGLDLANSKEYLEKEEKQEIQKKYKNY